MFGTVVEFTPAAGVEVYLAPSKVSKPECIRIGEAFYNAVAEDDTATQDAILNECGPTLTKRSLRAFANTVRKMGHTDVADAALMIRDEIKITRRSAQSA